MMVMEMSKRFCGKEMSDERMLVAISVLEGKLPPDVLSLDEVIEIQQKLMDLIAKLHQK